MRWWNRKSIESIIDQFWWPLCVTSKLMLISVSLIVSIYFLWTSFIVQMFHFLTFDIFLATWHLFDILTHDLQLKPPQPVTGLFSIFVLEEVMCIQVKRKKVTTTHKLFYLVNFITFYITSKKDLDILISNLLSFYLNVSQAMNTMSPLIYIG